jgi:RND family efflux transporter MFP subunit
MCYQQHPLRSAIRLSIAAFCLALSGCSGPDSHPQAAQQAPAANVISVQRGAIAHTLSLAGQFEPYQVVDVHAKVSGYIRKINVDIGDKVRAGQVLATLEVPELSAQLKGAVSEVGHSKDEIARAAKDVTRAESYHAALHANYLRLREANAGNPGIIAEQELDDAQSKDLGSEAQVEMAKSSLSGAQQQSDVASADRERVGALESYTTVTAPLSGVIQWRYADTGALIQSGTSSNTQSLPIVKLSQSDLLRLRVPVPESDVRFVHIGASVSVHVDALNRSFTGTVVRFTRNVSLETGTMETEIDVPNRDLAITPGMYANVQLDLERKDNVLVIPDSAVVQGASESTALVVNQDNRIEVRPVELGLRGSTLVEVTGGLKAGDRVINGGQSNYHSGEEVRPQAERAPTTDTKREESSEAQGGKKVNA